MHTADPDPPVAAETPRVSSGPPLISVLIVSWNRRDDLARALDSIVRQDYARREVVVVDNGSSDGTAELLKEFGQKYAGRLSLTVYWAGANLGAARARNLGLQLALGEFVCFLDSDAEFADTSTLARLAVRLMAESGVGGVAPAIFLDAARTQVWYRGGYYLRGGYCDFDRARAQWASPEYLTTCCSLWRTELVRRLGGFDPGLPYGFEDNELSARALQAGATLAIEPVAAAIHHISQVSRIRAEREGWAHYFYDERARLRVQLRRLGWRGMLREEAWLWLTAAGRKHRYWILLHAPFGRWRRHALCGRALLATLRARGELNRFLAGPDWLAQDPVRQEKIQRYG